ncbi:hypothetical protein [Gracilibacillus sp. JCM 18860]|uniref:hypothetical protein n=1 Tax=Gracilibacillus sp. JCM 18860 TaxID=1306159 RepID=UPI003260EEF7
MVFTLSLQRTFFKHTHHWTPPQSGKTTFLRDLARFVSTGTKEMKAHKTAIVDERSEICAATEGVPMSSIGLRVDVLDRCPKSEGMMMFVRSMSPDVIIVDEIGSDKDVQALMEVMNAGINLICTIHGKDLKDIQNRPAITPLINAEIFDRFIVLSNKHHTGEVLDILDSKGHPILERVNQS